jgi:flagellar biosynthesis protein FlhF
MRLRTFLADNMTAALATVRADMGPEAIIIASEKAKGGGVMVRAALDTPEEPAANDAPAAETPVADFEQHYRNTIMRRLNGAPAATVKMQGFDRSTLLATLARHRAPDALAHELAEAAAKAGLTDMTLALASAVDKRMTSAPIDFATAGAFLLAGTNGAGKTATAAKLAAHAGLAGRRTTLIAADAAGAGAVARLDAFARHLDAAIAVAGNAAELGKLVAECLAKNTFVVIDAAGFDPRHSKSHTAFAALGQIEGVETLGVVSALNDAEEIAEIVTGLGTTCVGRLIITGLDLARRSGAVLAAATQGVPLAHVTRSPFVAAGLEPLTPLALARLILDEQRSPQ